MEVSIRIALDADDFIWNNSKSCICYTNLETINIVHIIHLKYVAFAHMDALINISTNCRAKQ